MVEQVILKSVYDFILTSDTKSNIAVMKDSNEETQWVLVFSLNNSEKEIGITQNGYWGMNWKETFCILDKELSIIQFINLLENSMEEIKNKIHSTLAKFNEPIEIDHFFPFFEIVKYVFVYYPRDYWVNLSFEWYEQFNFSDKQSLKDNIEKLIINKTLSQRTRHRAKRELKNLNNQV